MRYQKLGNTGLFVSELCLGTMTFGGEEGMWGKIGQLRQAEAEQLVGSALDAGINFIDTANVYSEGRSEEITGQALKNLKIPRENVVVATKVFGETGTAGVNSRGSSRYHIMGSVKESLRRLQLDHIDLYQLHGFDPATPIEEMLSALDTLVQQGHVRYKNLYHSPEAFLITGYLRGDKTLRELYQIQHHVMMAHVHLTDYLHQAKPQCLMGGMLAHALVYPATCKPRDILCAQQLDEFLNQNLLRAYAGEGYSPEVMHFVAREGFDDIYRPEDIALMARVKVDYLAFSYYASRTLNSDAIPPGTAVNNYMLFGNQDNPYLKATEWNWQIDPLGFRTIITRYYNDWRLPVFPIENGIGVIESWDGENQVADDYRIAYHRDHINAMKAAMFEDGAQVIGYLGWGLIDILSSQGDMRKRYGVVYVNRENHDLKDLKRVPKKSYAWLKRVIHSNSEEM